ncbi:hypothetical protein [Kitasatospora aureofaciens]|uniref:hypothetical protein n=1 Tax=Kitasatospora aureofaciens TaxID=1894 RepID=UPI000AFC4854|nr:hypothetical protein [Kitasatospora aureofaciens]
MVVVSAAEAEAEAEAETDTEAETETAAEADGDAAAEGLDVAAASGAAGAVPGEPVSSCAPPIPATPRAQAHAATARARRLRVVVLPSCGPSAALSGTPLLHFVSVKCSSWADFTRTIRAVRTSPLLMRD